MTLVDLKYSARVMWTTLMMPLFFFMELDSASPHSLHGVENNSLGILLNTGTAGSQREDHKNNITVVYSHLYICLISDKKSSSQRPTAVTF